MRILHTNNFLDIGGAGTVMLELARGQKKLGHDVAICSMYGAGPVEDRAAEFGIPVIHLNCHGSKLARIRAMYRYLGKAPRYDVLNSHWGTWLATAVAGFFRRIPRVHTNHSNQARRLFIEHRIASFFTNKVVSLTPYVEPYIAKWVGVPKRKIATIPNGMLFGPLESATRVEIEGIPPEAPVIGMVARLSPPKDYPTFLRSAAIINKLRPDIHFIAVGNGQQREHYEAVAAEMKLQNFHFLGGRHDVPNLLRRMAALVLATRHEGHPMGLVEGMISGVPCIGSDIPSVRYTLDEGRAGLLFPGGDADALAKAVLQIVNDKELRDRLISHAHVFAQHFSVERMTQDYLDLYAQIIPKH